ncbi:MAG: zf-HC2 domain-containing protein [Actinomycetota bacterium]|nr:zf-HC2 domain-containing protein [Actinomycetota bacterium]
MPTFALFRRRRAIVCREAVELVTDYLEGALTARDRARFEAHLAECPHCHDYLEQMRTTIAVLGRIESEALEPDVRDELVALYRRWRQD